MNIARYECFQQVATNAIRQEIEADREAIVVTVKIVMQFLPRELDFPKKDVIASGSKVAADIDLNVLRCAVATRVVV